MDEGEFVIMTKMGGENNDEPQFLSGGYKINSNFLSHGISPITTYTNGDIFGGKASPVLFENLAVPAGLYYINQPTPKKEFKSSDTSYAGSHKMLPDEIHDKLFSLIEIHKRKQRKTRRNINKTNNNKKTIKNL